MEQSTTFYNRLPMWGKLVFILLYPVSIPYGIYRMWMNKRFTPLVRAVLSATAALAFLISITPSTDATVIPSSKTSPQIRSSVSEGAEAAKDAAAERAEEEAAIAKAAAAKAATEEAAAQEAARAAAEQAAAEEAARIAAAQAAAQEAARVAAEQAAAAAAAAAKPAPPSSGGTVYITNTGEKYHRNGCQYLSKSQIPISLSDAEASGYTPCSRCF